MSMQQVLLAMGGQITPPLDLFGSASSAYSVRKVRTAYAGSALRVVTSAAGNAEQDIGFDLSGNLDTAALLSFIGANNGTVKTWYDQSGNGLDVTQSTLANQPVIVNAGALVTRNGRPSLLGNGTSTLLASAYSMTSMKTSRQNSLAIVHQSLRTAGVAEETMFAFQRSGGYPYQSGFRFQRRTTNLAKWFGSGSVGAFSTALFNGQQAANSNVTALTVGQSFDDGPGAADSFYVNGTLQTLSSVSGSLSIGNFMTDASTAAHRAMLFAESDNAGVIAAWFSGYISESISWSSSQVANRVSIKSNQAAYFGTP